MCGGGGANGLENESEVAVAGLVWYLQELVGTRVDFDYGRRYCVDINVLHRVYIYRNPKQRSDPFELVEVLEGRLHHLNLLSEHHLLRQEPLARRVE